MKKQHILFVLLFLIVLSNAVSEDLPRIDPLDFYSQISVVKSDLTEKQFVYAALLASGTGNIEVYTSKFTEAIDEIAAALPPGLSEYDKGEKILMLLHKQIFRRYREDQTRIDVVMDTGVYNCVSSAVFYMGAARTAGLPVQGVKTVDHAFISMEIDGRIVDVETTNIWGFDPGQKKEFTDSFTGSTGYNYVPPGHYSKRQNINDKELIGLILQNRIAGLQQMGNHRDAVPLAVDRYVLTGSEEARQDMFGAFSNYSSLLNSGGQYSAGIDFLASAIGKWGGNSKVHSALEALIHNYILSMLDNGKYDEAETYLNDLRGTGLVSVDAIRSSEEMIYDKKTVNYINSGKSYEEIQNFLDEIAGKGFLSQDKWADYTLYGITKEAERLVGTEGWLQAYLFVKNAPSGIQEKQKYRQLLENIKGNFVVVTHNSFADLFNAGKYDDAEKAVLKGLSLLPDNRTFLADLQLVRKKNSP